MKGIRAILAMPFLVAIFGLSAVPAGAESIFFKVDANPQNNYCHMKFPAIREETLASVGPVLKDPNEGDIIDFYGSCNHDPLGKEEIQAQLLDAQRERSRSSGE